MCSAFRSRAAGSGKERRCGGAVPLALVRARGGLRPQRRLQTWFHKPLPYTGPRGGMHFQGLPDRFVAPGCGLLVLIGLEQKAGRPQGAGGGFPAANHW